MNDKHAKIYNKDNILHIEIPLLQDVLKADINSYYSFDAASEFQIIVKEITDKLIDEYIDSLKEK